jgi:hypothetical protein
MTRGFANAAEVGWTRSVIRATNAAHELPQMSFEDAKELVEFTQMLVRFVYDLPARAPKP